MFRARVSRRLGFGVVLVNLVAVVAAGVLLDKAFHADERARFLRELDDGAALAGELLAGELLAGELAAESGAALEATLRRLSARLGGTRLQLLNAGAEVIAESDPDPTEARDLSDRPEVREARSNGTGRFLPAGSAAEATPFGYAVWRIDGHRDGEVRGFARAGRSVERLEAAREQTRRRLALALAAAFVAATGFGLFLVAYAWRAMGELAAAAESLAAAQEPGRPSSAWTRRPGDLMDLAGSLRRLAVALRERRGHRSQDQTQLLAVLGGMVEGVVVVDRDERIVHLNDAARKILGTEARRRPWLWELTANRAFADAVARVVREGVEVRFEVEVPGEIKAQIIELNASPIRAETGEVEGGVMVLHDITKLRQLESIRRDFVANVSHELKTPVTAIRGLIETLHDDAEMAPEIREGFLRKAANQCMRLSALVTDLLTLSRLESAPGSLERQPLDLKVVINEAIQSLGALAEERGLDLRTSLPALPVTVWGDAESLHQVVSNLVDNAIKYTPDGGRVDIRLRTGEEHAIFEVQDTGIGISAEEKERVFERFYRVDKSRSRELGGTGLGLSIVKHVVLYLDGEVSVESEPEAGSTFRVELPLADQPA